MIVRFMQRVATVITILTSQSSDFINTSTSLVPADFHLGISVGAVGFLENFFSTALVVVRFRFLQHLVPDWGDLDLQGLAIQLGHLIELFQICICTLVLGSWSCSTYVRHSKLV